MKKFSTNSSRWPCQYCSHIYHSSKALQNHMRIHRQNGLTKKEIMKKTLKKKKILKKNQKLTVSLRGEKITKKYNKSTFSDDHVKTESDFYKKTKVGKKNFFFPNFEHDKNDKNVIHEMYLGPDIKLLMEKLGYKNLTLNTVYNIGKDLFETLKVIHSNGYCHGDLKPDNIVWNYKYNRISIIDFDHSYKPGDGHHTGNLNYKGISEDPYISEIQSVFYILVYLSNGCLPWSGIAKTPMSLMKEKMNNCITQYVSSKKLIKLWNEINLASERLINYEKLIDPIRPKKTKNRFQWQKKINKISTSNNADDKLSDIGIVRYKNIYLNLYNNKNFSKNFKIITNDN